MLPFDHNTFKFHMGGCLQFFAFASLLDPLCGPILKEKPRVFFSFFKNIFLDPS
jgi:hypothetical protein